jgi:hypothetical protein
MARCTHDSSRTLLPISRLLTSHLREFWEESRSAKLFRKLRQEPLVPLGLALTCYALFGATRSIRRGDKEATNRYFRARVYAQGFTLLCVCAGAIYWKEDREKRKTYRGLVDEKKAKEKREAWIRELEIREMEDEREREKRRRRRRGESEMIADEDIAVKAVDGAREASQGGVGGSPINSSPLDSKRLGDLVAGRGIIGEAMKLWWSS